MSIDWSTSPDGSFSLRANGILLEQCYPEVDGQSLRPMAVKVSADQIRYELVNGASLTLQFHSQGERAWLDAVLEGWRELPWRISPMAGRLAGAEQLYRLGLGFSGPSGWVDLAPAGPLVSHESYLTTAFSSSDRTLAIGALTHDDFLQKTLVMNRQTRRGLTNRHVESAENHVEIAFFTEGIPAPATLKLPTLVFQSATDSYSALRLLANEIAEAMHCRRSQDAAYHWCSWYEKGCNFSMADLQELLAGLNKMPNPPALQSIQIDDGYCPHAGDWLTPSALWPEGLEGAFGETQQAGYRPGVWVAPFMVGSLSELYRDHPDWIIREKSGKPLVEWKKYDASGIPSHVDPEHYALDASHPGVQEYLRQVFRTLRRWGARLYKTDFMDWGLRDSQQVIRYNPRETSVQSFRRVLSIIREEIGDDSYWLACISPYAPFLGFADGMRIANDVGPHWGDGSHGNMIQEAMATLPFNNIFWQNDPDAILLRDYHNDLSALEVRSLAIFQAFLGTSVNFSDMPHKLPPDRQALMHALRPPQKVSSATLVNWQSSSPVKIAHRRYADGSSAVLLMNSSSQPQLEVLEVKSLTGRDSVRAFDWNPGESATSLGEVRSLITRLSAHEAKLLYLSDKGEGPAAGMTITGRLASR